MSTSSWSNDRSGEVDTRASAPRVRRRATIGTVSTEAPTGVGSAGSGFLAHPAQDPAVDPRLALAGADEPVLERLDPLDLPPEHVAVEARAALGVGRVDLEVDRPHRYATPAVSISGAYVPVRAAPFIFARW